MNKVSSYSLGSRAWMYFPCIICLHKIETQPHLCRFKLAWNMSLMPCKLRQHSSLTFCFKMTSEFKHCFGSNLNLAVGSAICSQRGSGYWWYVAAAACRSLENSDTLTRDNERCMIKPHQCHPYIWPCPTDRGSCLLQLPCSYSSLLSFPVETLTPTHSTSSTHMSYKGKLRTIYRLPSANALKDN